MSRAGASCHIFNGVSNQADDDELDDEHADEAEGEPTIGQLPLHDQLLHGIGRVAQAQVRVEVALRQLYEWLTLPGPAAYLASTRWGISQLVADCRVLLANAGLSDEVKAAGEDALNDAKKADELRHRVVHDWWVRLMGSDESTSVQFSRLRAATKALGDREEPSDLDFVNNAEDELNRVWIRLNSLAFVASQAMFGGGPPMSGAPTTEQLLVDIRGDFELVPNGGWRRSSERPGTV